RHVQPTRLPRVRRHCPLSGRVFPNEEQTPHDEPARDRRLRTASSFLPIAGSSQMRTGAKAFAIGAAVLAVVITACVDATANTSPTETALYEGAAVSMAPENIQVSGIIDGKLVSSAVHQWAVDGIVTNGIAQAKSQPGQLVDSKTMPALTVTDNHPFAHGRPNERLFTSTKDKAGNTHDFAFLSGKSDGPT